MITLKDITNNPAIKTYIQKADESLAQLGYTEHSFAHVNRVSQMAGNLIKDLGFDERTIELTRIAGYIHDIGNLTNRVEHSQSGAVMAFCLLTQMNCPPEDIAAIVSAIGNHDEGTGVPVNEIAAALIIADKSDVRRSRVRVQDPKDFDIHDRVNYSVTESVLKLRNDKSEVVLDLTVDTSVSPVMNYFEIFLDRMLLCRRAAEKLGTQFKLVINGQTMI